MEANSQLPRRLLPFREGAGFLRQTCKFRNRLHAELRRDARAVQLHSAFADVEIVGNLLVQSAAQNVLEHLALPITQLFEPRLNLPRSRARHAPPRIARTVEGMSPWPVRKMTGIALLVRVSAACKSSPVISGICKSTSAQPGVSVSSCARNCSADLNGRTSKPLARRSRAAAERYEASSSTMNTVGFTPRPLSQPVA